MTALTSLSDSRTFTISELARDFDVTPRAIRHYEDLGLLAPERRGQHRIYSRRDRVRLMLTLRGKRIGLTLTEIRELYHLYDTANDDESQLYEFIKLLSRREASLAQQRLDLEAIIKEVRALKTQCEYLMEKRTGGIPDNVPD